jgi:hypothetical protein
VPDRSADGCRMGDRIWQIVGAVCNLVALLEVI